MTTLTRRPAVARLAGALLGAAVLLPALALPATALSATALPATALRVPPALSATALSSAGTARVFGVAEPGAPTDLAPLARLTSDVGRAPTSVTWYAAWSSGSGFPATAAAAVADTGATPEVTWEPWDPSAGTDQPSYALARIAGGAFDAYLRTWGRQIKAYKRPVVLRFAHEMNGSWYPWDEQVNGNRPGQLVAAWRHVHDVVAAQGASNVVWKWSPNVPYQGSADLAELYPGDAYVDQVALDGYNWSTLQPTSTWQSFWQVFGPGVGQVEALTSRPLSVGEVGCPEVGGDKAAWVSDMFGVLAAHPDIRGFTWFDYAKETDWRIASSPASLSSFRAGLASYR